MRIVSHAECSFEESSQARGVRAIRLTVLTMIRALNYPELFGHFRSVVELAREFWRDGVIVRASHNYEGAGSDFADDIDRPKLFDVHMRAHREDRAQACAEGSAVVDGPGLFDSVTEGAFQDDGFHTRIERCDLCENVRAGREAQSTDFSVFHIGTGREKIERTFESGSFRSAELDGSAALTAARHIEEQKPIARFSEHPRFLERSFSCASASVAKNNCGTRSRWDVPARNHRPVARSEGHACYSECNRVGRGKDPTIVSEEVVSFSLIAAEALRALPKQKKEAGEARPAQHSRHSLRVSSVVCDTELLITIRAERCQEWREDISPFAVLPNEPEVVAIGLRGVDLGGRRIIKKKTSAVEIVDNGLPCDAPRSWGALPPHLSRAAPKRLASFLAGRHCAAPSLRAAGYSDTAGVGIGATGSPLWPAGFVGSITHAAQMAVAVVAPAKVFRGIGIDCERLMSSRTTEEVWRTILPDARELAIARDLSMQMPWRVVVSIIFSAKESVYKCVRPLVDDFFEFADCRVVGADPSRGVLRMALVRSLGGGFDAGRELDCRFVTNDDWVHTMTSLERTES